MKIIKIKISNYRLLRNFEIDLEKNLSLVIGKNNTGKTSFLSILEKFLDKSNSISFSFDDFNIEFQRYLEKQVKEIYKDQNKIEKLYKIKSDIIGISLKIFIEYDEEDNLANINKLMMDLNPENNIILLVFEYSIPEDKLIKLITDFENYKIKNIERDDKNFFCNFMKKEYNKYFEIIKRSVLFEKKDSKENFDNYINLDKEKISLDKILNFKVIYANRNVSNQRLDKTLSTQSSRYYYNKSLNENESDDIKQFKKLLSETDEHLDDVYGKLFKSVIDKIKKFGGIKEGDSIIKIISTLQHRDLLSQNTTVMYNHCDEYSLPEYYNGLGYMNLIYMIFELEIILTEFRKENKKNNEFESPADINLLFIEEPEAHTHPQMQYVFIKNIKNLLKSISKGKKGNNLNLQTIITTHSSHITSESDYDDIKYFYCLEKNEVIAKNLKDLKKEYEKDGEVKNYKFLKQYLTLHRADLFFADKAIFIEGDTERILLPAMMKKIDQEDKQIKGKNINIPLLSQNISIVEVGAYSQVFEKFIDFIGVKSLIITDIDSGDKDGVKCKVADNEACITTNSSLKYFFNFDKLDKFIKMKIEEKIISKNNENKKWEQNKDGNVLLVYQISEKNSYDIEYNARSFEDAFFHINCNFIIDNKDNFKSLKKKEFFSNPEYDSYDLAEKCINKKPSFAIEILLNSETDDNNNEFSNWEIPAYIKEGLEWLKMN